MPGEGGALDAHRVLADAGEDLELAEVGRAFRRALGDQLMETVEGVAGALDGEPLERLGHQRGGRRRDGAPRPLEGDALEAPGLDVQIDGHPVAAEGIVPFRAAVRGGQRTEVAGVPVVVEDDLLIELAQVAHPNSSRARWRAAARAPTSSGVL